MRKPIAAIAMVAGLALIASGCAAATEPTEPVSAGEYIVDPSAERITDDQAKYLTELYESAKEEGKLVIYTGLPSDMEGTIELFEEMFPGIPVTAEQLIGAPLVQALSAEKASGNFVADILQNPDGQLYVSDEATGNFSEPYEVRTLAVPAGLESSADYIIDPEHRFSVPFVGFFGLGAFLPRVEQAGGMPTSWSDLADSAYKGLLGMGDPSIPGPQQGALIYLLNNGGLDEKDLPGIGANTIVKGDYGQAIGGLLQGEYAFMPGAPASPMLGAAASGAPSASASSRRTTRWSPTNTSSSRGPAPERREALPGVPEYLQRTEVRCRCWSDPAQRRSRGPRSPVDIDQGERRDRDCRA
ncbi:type 2 periplasmic-binding domain-containing protein [Homoserinimonas sp. A520]